MQRELVVRGARVHNLQNVDLRLPHDALIVVTGPSGSGKSSLALHTIFAEGQRRYVESLSTYARRFLQQLPKPDVDLIEGLRPALSVPQRAPGRNPRSTIATATEISDHLRVLYARAGTPHCPVCDEPLTSSTAQNVVDSLLAAPEGTRLTLLAPVLRGGTDVGARRVARAAAPRGLRARAAGRSAHGAGRAGRHGPRAAAARRASWRWWWTVWW
jgi:excinuclease ABC subunit A